METKGVRGRAHRRRHRGERGKIHELTPGLAPRMRRSPGPQARHRRAGRSSAGPAAIQENTAVSKGGPRAGSGARVTEAMCAATSGSSAWASGCWWGTAIVGRAGGGAPAGRQDREGGGEGKRGDLGGRRII